MIVSYDGIQMRSLALEEATANDRLGEVGATRFHAMLAEIEAAEGAHELFSLYGNGIAINGEDSLSVMFGPGLQARFRIVREKGAFDAAAQPVWSEVRRLKLTGVETDRHVG